MSRNLLTTLYLSAVAASCFGQTPIPVREEPRHHNVFENRWVRILDVRIPPGDTSLMHKHETPSVFIVLGNTKTGSQVLVEPAKVQFSHENIWFESFASSPRIHRVWNSDTTEFHTVDMELPDKDLKAIDPPLTLKELNLLFDEAQVRGYRLTLAAHKALRVPKRKAPIVVVSLGNAAGYATANNKTFVKRGDFVFIPADSELDFSNSGGNPQDLAVFEIK